MDTNKNKSLKYFSTQDNNKKTQMNYADFATEETIWNLKKKKQKRKRKNSTQKYSHFDCKIDLNSRQWFQCNIINT